MQIDHQRIVYSVIIFFSSYMRILKGLRTQTDHDTSLFCNISKANKTFESSTRKVGGSRYFLARFFFEAIKPKNATLDIMLSTLRNDPTENTLPNEPIDPIENAEPLEPMDINELVDQRLSTEFLEPMLLIEFSLSISSA